jgi:hypothetical protein
VLKKLAVYDNGVAAGAWVTETEVAAAAAPAAFVGIDTAKMPPGL